VAVEVEDDNEHVVVMGAVTVEVEDGTEHVVVMGAVTVEVEDGNEHVVVIAAVIVVDDLQLQRMLGVASNGRRIIMVIRASQRRCAPPIASGR
jgi:hypothetical protein